MYQSGATCPVQFVTHACNVSVTHLSPQFTDLVLRCCCCCCCSAPSRPPPPFRPLPFALSDWQSRHPVLLYVVSELLKTFASEPAADGSMGPILAALLGSSVAGLGSLQVRCCRGTWGILVGPSVVSCVCSPSLPHSQKENSCNTATMQQHHF